MPIDLETKALLRELGRSMTHSLSASAEVRETLQRLRERGFTLGVVVDCQHTVSGETTQLQLIAESPESSPSPEYRLGGDDVEFLRSVGIDPTRSARRRR